MTITSERPGVYTSYQVTNSSYAKASKGVVGLVGVAGAGNSGQVYSIKSVNQARSTFGNSRIARLAEILFKNGVYEVKASPVFADNDGSNPGSLSYYNAFALLVEQEDVQIIICDSDSSPVHDNLKTLIMNADNHNKHKLGIVEFDSEVSTVVRSAERLNCERLLMVTPGGLDAAGNAADVGAVSAAVAGAILAEKDPAVPLNGAELYGLGGVRKVYSENDIDTLVKGGVCPVECVSGKVSVIRGVTTYSTDENGESDPTWHELTTVRIVDEIVPEIRDSLKAMFARSKNTAQTRDAIRTQVVIILEKKLAAEIIESYGNVVVTQDEHDPTVCNVVFEFAVAHGLNKIILTANITV